ncbi:phosphate ABC transporter permease subunit PstC [uncultured Jatrophihabitans sp.]|uniref:phosphate ABC transporter permease subunit PstC n=1 Tax=uncultured Jatrophihabitans sp. TaxID=1610747 RepID=UPI0035CBF334
MTDRAQRRQTGDALPPPSIGGESVTDSNPPSLSETATAPEHVEALTSSEPLTAGFGGSATPVPGAGAATGGARRRIGDRIFGGLASGAALAVILLVVLIATFLIIQSVPAISADKDNFLTSTSWQTDANNLHFGVAPLLYSTVMISIIAMIIAVPIAVGIALFMTQYAPRRIAKPVAYVIDLLAAIPSIIYGIWGVLTFAPHLDGVQRLLSHIPGPLFSLVQQNKTIFDGGVVLAIMILPIVTAISRDVFERTPRANIEAALALGATKWEMIRMAVLPYGRAGVVSGAMLGLGRALGETVAIYIIVSSVSPPFHFSIFNGGETIASKIANGSAEFTGGKSTGAYIAAGLVLFILTFAVNSAARYIVNRKKDFV